MYPDLFGDTITTPRTASPKGLLNAAHGFPEFWAAWPAGTRKVGKQKCLDKWAKLGCSCEASKIEAHVLWMRTQDDWMKQQGAFIPMPMTYLSQQRWIDWEQPKERPKEPSALEVIKSHVSAPMPDEVRKKLQELRGKR